MSEGGAEFFITKEFYKAGQIVQHPERYTEEEVKKAKIFYDKICELLDNSMYYRYLLLQGIIMGLLEENPEKLAEAVAKLYRKYKKIVENPSLAKSEEHYKECLKFVKVFEKLFGEKI